MADQIRKNESCSYFYAANKKRPAQSFELASFVLGSELFMNAPSFYLFNFLNFILLNLKFFGIIIFTLTKIDHRSHQVFELNFIIDNFFTQ